MQIFTIIGSISGILALAWNIVSNYQDKRGVLVVELGWATKEEDYSTYFVINVYNRGVDTRIIDGVYLIWLDGSLTKDQRVSTTSFIKGLPRTELKRGEVATEHIFYQESDLLPSGHTQRPFVIRVKDTMGKYYDSPIVNNGGFSLK
jgi:hypothetical protein